MPPIIRRKREAVALNLSRYYSGKPCPHGHLAERFTQGGCVICNVAKTERWREKQRLALGLPPPKRNKKKTVTTVPPRVYKHNRVRAVIKEVRNVTKDNPNGASWRVRCVDSTALAVDIGDVVRQRENLPLMVVGATVEFDLIGGDLIENVEVAS
jgi:hypothetical protein